MDDLTIWAFQRFADLNDREFDRSFDALREGRKVLAASGFASPELADEECARLVADGFVARRDALPLPTTGDWWVYAWSDAGLRQLLADSAASRWTEPAEFVDFVRSQVVTPNTPLFDLIADAYGDKTGPGRTDVLPGRPKAELLRRFREVIEREEPTSLYFSRTGRRQLARARRRARRLK